MNTTSSYFRRLKTIILFIITISYLVFLSTEIISLKNKTYLINESDLYRLDSVKLMSRIYKGGGGRSFPEFYEFESQNGFSSIIEGNSYTHLNNMAFLYDTLQYSATSLTIYTDKKGYNSYFKQNKSAKIQVYQLVLDNKKFVDTISINISGESDIWWIVIFCSIAYLLLFVYIYKLEKFD